MTKPFTKPLCRECPHQGQNSLRGVTDLFVNGKQQDYHPCHMDTHLMCSGAIERVALIQGGAPMNGDQVKFTHKVELPNELARQN